MGCMAGTEDWDDTIRNIVTRGGLVLVIGGPDTGKTTFCQRAALAAIEAGHRVAIVDADVGQAEVGPPGCVSLAVASAPFGRLADLEPIRSAFVGAISPRYATLEHLAAVCRIVQLARSMDAGLLLCDTTGYTRGPAARRLKFAKEFALRPDYVIELTRMSKTHSYRPVPDGSGATARNVTLPVPSCLAPKPPKMRAQRREHRLFKALEGSVVREWPMESVRLSGTWIGSGEPLTPNACAQLTRALRRTVVYAETRTGHLGIITTESVPSEVLLTTGRELYGAVDISQTLESSLSSLLAGLNDAAGDLLGLGRLIGLDYTGRILRVATPTHSHGLVREIRMGLTRVDQWGRTLATLRPGDV